MSLPGRARIQVCTTVIPLFRGLPEPMDRSVGILRDSVAEPVAAAQVGHGVVAPALGGAVIPPHGLASIAADALPVEESEAQAALGVRISSSRGGAEPFHRSGTSCHGQSYTPRTRLELKLNLVVGAALLAGVAATAAQDNSKEALRGKLKDTDVHPSWIYDDVPAAIEAATKSGRPILAVFR